MERKMKPLKVHPLLFALLGVALIYMAYRLADGQQRAMPWYAFPEPAFNCNPTYVVRPNMPPPQLSGGYSDSELLSCYPRKDYPFYALAIFGMILCIGAWITSRKMVSVINSISAVAVALSMLIVGVRIFKLEFSLFGSPHRPPDVFNSLSVVMVIMAFFMGSVGVVSLVAQDIKGNRHESK
jgi:hypothetical protein